jgi:release factor glutamine methyltransferase
MSTVTVPDDQAMSLRLRTLPGVFRPRSDALLAARVLAQQRLVEGADVLDLFTGSGVLAICAARLGARSVTAVDLSRRAQLATRQNARRNGVTLRALRGDLFAPVGEGRFDVILANPPYLPGADELPRRGAARAWEGGPDGRLLVDRLIDEVPAHLRDAGVVVIVQSSLTGEAATLGRLRERGLVAEVLARQSGRLGPLAHARADRLRTIGALNPGDDHEQMLVIAARRDACETRPVGSELRVAV